MNRFWADFRYAVRSLFREPGFTTVAALTLALGIGTTTAMFSVAHAVLWRPLPFAQPDRLVEIWETNPLMHWTDAPVAPANFADWQRRNKLLSGIAAYNGQSIKADAGFDVFLTGSGEPRRLKATAVTGNLFRVLGANARLGRTFTDEETFAGKNRVAVLSDGLWQSAFGGDPNIVGKNISLNGRNYVVVGVMPAEFFFPSRGVELWIPLGYEPKVFVERRQAHGLRAIARLRPGVTLTQAQSEMSAIAAQLEREYPYTNTKMSVGLGPFRDWTIGGTRSPLLILLGAVGFLLLIVCANVANLQLSRGVRRAREIGIRTALGASRGQIAQQLLTESLAISLLGGVLGLGLAAALRALLLSASPGALPLFSEVRIDWTVAAFNFAVALLAPALFGVLPAWSSFRTETLSDRSHAASGHSRRARSVLVASEIALSVMLVAGAGLLVQSLLSLERVNPGFNPDRVLSFTLALPSVRYSTDPKMVAAVAEIERRLQADPRVQHEGAISGLPLKGSVYTGAATIEGRPAGEYQRELWHKSVTPDYFRAIGTPLLHGRMLDDHDGQHDGRPGGQLVTMVNETLARKYFPGEDAVGKRIRFGRPTEKDPWVVIVGVVADAKQDGMDQPVQPEVYVPFADDTASPVSFVLRSSADPAELAALVRREVHGVDKDLVPTDIVTMRELVSGSLQQERFRTALLSGFAGAALLLAAIGIYGVLAYLVTQRTREIGIRMALGAQQPQLLAMIFRQGMGPVAYGVALGIAGALACARLIRTLLFGVDATNPATYAAAAATLLMVAMCACYFPARRATQVDPIVALRDE
jgi:putative ABC transport system permease protein